MIGVALLSSVAGISVCCYRRSRIATEYNPFPESLESIFQNGPKNFAPSGTGELFRSGKSRRKRAGRKQIEVSNYCKVILASRI